MAPARRRGSGRAAAASAAARQWEVGDLVLAKMKGFPAWPATIADPEKWGYSSHRKKVLVYFFGTKQIAFCNQVDIDLFTEEKKKALLNKRHGKGSDFGRALDEIIDSFDKSQKQKLNSYFNSVDGESTSDSGNFDGSSCKSSVSPNSTVQENAPDEKENGYISNDSPMEGGCHHSLDAVHEDSAGKASILDELRQIPLGTANISTWRKRSRDAPSSTCVAQKRTSSIRRSRKSLKVNSAKFRTVEATIARGSCPVAWSEHAAAEPECAVGNDSSNQFLGSFVCPDLDRDISPVVVLPNGADKNVDSKPVVDSSKFYHVEVDSLLQPMFKDVEPIDEKTTSECWERSNEIDVQDLFQMEVEMPNGKRSPSKRKLNEDLSSHCPLNEEEKSHPVSQRSSLSPFNSCTKSNGPFLKTDGDEHLPLVKRARARMRGPPVEEMQLDQVVVHDSLDKEETSCADVCDKSDKEVTSGAGSKENTLSTDNNSAVVSCARDGISSITSVSSLPLNDCILPKSNHTCKTCPVKGVLMDAEAALPPSKRLHRALEAMCANAAEARDNVMEAPLMMKALPNDCTESSSLATQTLNENMATNLEDSDHMKLANCPEVSNGEVNVTPSAASNVSIDPSERQMKMDRGKNSLLEVTTLRNCENTSCFSNEVSCMAADKNIELEAISETCQPCSIDRDMVKSDISPESMVTESSSSVVDAVNTLPPSKMECPVSAEGHGISSQMDKFEKINVSLETTNRRQDSVMKSIGSLSLNSTNVSLAVSPVGLSGGFASESTRSSSSVSSKNVGISSMSQLSSETKQASTVRDLSFSPDLTPMKVLIAAAQAKRLLSRSSSLVDSAIDTRASLDNNLSPSYFRVGSTDRSFTHNEKSDYMASSRSPDPNRRFRNSAPRMEVNDHTSGLVHKDSQKESFSEHEADIAFKSFEAQLSTLTRAKESIARATRRAIDCAKHNVANEVVESIVISLEKEPSLHRRVDMFFLVDSITRSCRSQTGTVGDVFISLLLPILPRLISAAAPPGTAAYENRRQCLKVVRLWLERRTFPESIVRHHIRELESITEPSLSNGFSRRPSRTERALDDPVREMEGMLVDEYGSNTSFHLPGLLASRVTNDDDEGSDADDKIFEAVTPERLPVVPVDPEPSVAAEKHKHILEDVDGELEMEDVAPPSEIGAVSSFDASVEIEKQHPSVYHFDQHTSLTYAPPLPEERPPSPPPLPSSPPPTSLPCPVQELSTSNPTSILSGANHQMGNENHFPLSVNPRSEGQNINLKSEPYYAPAYRDFPNNMPPPLSSLRSCYYNNNPGPHPSTQSGPDSLSVGSGTSTSSAYFLQPPPAVISNQFSYVQPELLRPIAKTSPRRSTKHEKCRFPSVSSGTLYPENTEPPSSHQPYFCPQSESSPVASKNWSHPPRASFTYPGHPSRPPGNSFPQMAGASAHWRPQ